MNLNKAQVPAQDNNGLNGLLQFKNCQKCKEEDFYIQSKTLAAACDKIISFLKDDGGFKF